MSALLLLLLLLMKLFPLYPSLWFINGLAYLGDYKVVKNQPYADNALNHLDIYIPTQKHPKDQTSFPTVIFFYGGCWGGCLTLEKKYYRFVADSLTEQGYLTVIPDYRRHPQVRFPSIMADAKQVVEWVEANIGDYGGDSKHIFLMGHSAGAHLAATLSLNPRYLSAKSYANLAGFVGLAGPYDFLPFTDAYQFEVFAPESAYFESQPINFVDGTEIPLLLLYGNQDQRVFPHNIKNLSEKVKQKGGNVETHLYDEIDHMGLIAALTRPYREQKTVLKDIIKFLHQHSD